MESVHLTALRVLAAVAWADGTLAPAEADLLGRAIASAPLEDRERAAARRLLRETVALATLDLPTLGEAQREAIYRSAVQMAAADQDVAQAERALLVRLRRELGLS